MLAEILAESPLVNGMFNYHFRDYAD